MLISGASSYAASTASLLPARAPVSGASAEVSTANTRTTQSPVSAAQKQEGDQSASAREEADKSGKTQQDKSNPKQERIEQLEVAKLSQRDQEVRAHEQAHAAVGGRYAGAPSFTYTTGPDGKRYAIGGEVSIDSGAIANDPEATLRKMEVVIRAALAPAEPSAQDQRVAAQAQVTMGQARADLAQLRREESQATREAQQPDEAKETDAEDAQNPRSASPAGLELYRSLSGVQEPSAGIDVQA